MRVVRIIGVLEPGGAQLSALRLSRSLAGFGVDSSLLLAGDATEAGTGVACRYGVSIEAFSPGEHRRLQWAPDGAFVDWLRPRLVGADLVHAHMFGAWWAAAAALKGVGTPLVASEHNAVSWPHGDYSAAAKAAARRLAAFFAHGPAARAFAATLGLDPRGVHEGRSAVEGLDASPLPDLATPRLTFTGRFREDKGPDVLVEALPLLADELGELPHCYLVGDGPMRSWLQRRVHELGVAERVRFTGWTYQPAGYVAGAAVHVVPSREEAWSQSAVVAMGLGVPVVGAAVEGLPLTLGVGRGLLVAPEDPRALAAGIAGILRGEQRTDLDGGRAYARPVGPTVEVKPGLALPPSQHLLLPGPLGVVEDHGRAGGQPVTQDGQCGVARQPVAGGVGGWAIHQEQVDGIAPQCDAQTLGERGVVVPAQARLGAWVRGQGSVDHPSRRSPRPHGRAAR